jgi:xanthine dehydrogenase accessory factor
VILLHPELVVVRGAGDLATGCIALLKRAGFKVIALEIGRPSSIRRPVCLSEAMYEGEASVEGIIAVRVDSPEDAMHGLGEGVIPILEDPACSSLPYLQPFALIDAIMAKKNTGTLRGMAPVVIALGPGFAAGIDADAVIETARGHDLGRPIYEGSASPDTGVPGLIGGQGALRLIRASADGVVEPLLSIGEFVVAGQILARLLAGDGVVEVRTGIDGILRGMIHPGFPAHSGLKIADVDPRCEASYCFSISDKSRAIAGGVLEALCVLSARTE